MGIELNSPVVVELVSRLTADLPAAIDAVNAAVTDGFTIAKPVDVLDYPPPPELLNDFPTVSVSDGPSKFEDDIGSSATGRHLLLICAFCQSDDQRDLAWQLRRYAKAIVRVALDGRHLGTAAWGTGLEGVYPGPAYADNADPESVKTWMSWVGVRIWAKRDEE